MPVTYRVDPERNVVLATATGTLTIEDLQAYFSSVLTDPDVRPGINELLDFRQVTEVAIVPLDLSPVGDLARVFEQGIKQARSAFVSSKENEVVVLALFRPLQGLLPTESRFFADWKAAQEWLGLSEDTQERRSAPRKSVSLSVRCRSGLEEASGQLRNVSLSGALIESNSLRPGRGRFVNIRLHAPKIDEEIELIGTVVRQTNAGFAVQFLNVTQPLRQLLA